MLVSKPHTLLPCQAEPWADAGIAEGAVIEVHGILRRHDDAVTAARTPCSRHRGAMRSTTHESATD